MAFSVILDPVRWSTPGASRAASEDHLAGRDQEIAAELQTGMKTVCQWRSRFFLLTNPPIKPIVRRSIALSQWKGLRGARVEGRKTTDSVSNPVVETRESESGRRTR